MKIIKNFALILALLISTINSSMAELVKAEATTFKNTVHAMQLCESGSSLTNCVNPTTIGNSTAGKTMDLSVRGSAHSFGNAGLIPPGITYTHGQVILSRTFTISGTVVTSAATCKTGGTAGTKAAGGATNNAAEAAQVLMVPNSEDMTTSMNSTSAIVDGTDADPANVEAAHDFVKFRWVLSKPLTVKPGQIPTMTMTFDLSEALEFNDGGSGNGACDGNDFFPGAPVITNTFE
ncbi:hypothetical protein IDH20_02920 [Pelagibacterales bacterium SAG-MED39]|nr:hypothetical protein [Pelagibacterales bacterium SAG-MED39]